MNDKIDICTTATLRANILDETLKSFTSKMLKNKDRYRLIINIDPIGDKLKRRHLVLNVARKYFNNVIYNLPDTPGFTKAVQWCWSKTTAPYVFHLEDDWRLLYDINVDDMIEMMKSHKLTSLRLNKADEKKTKSYVKFGFTLHPKISLNPTLFDGDFIRMVAPKINLNANPEKQLRPSTSELGKIIIPTRHAIYQKVTLRKVVLDIGRQWMTKSRFHKKTGFMHWEVKKGTSND
jgi:hypothetical protein